MIKRVEEVKNPNENVENMILECFYLLPNISALRPPINLINFSGERVHSAMQNAPWHPTVSYIRRHQSTATVGILSNHCNYCDGALNVLAFLAEWPIFISSISSKSSKSNSRSTS